MHPHRAHAGNARLADVRAQPSPWFDSRGVRVSRRDQNLAYRMRGGDFLLLRRGREAHIRRRNLRGNEALDRLLGILWGMTRSKVRSG